MALNLWKIGGQPTSFNPLPLGASAVITTSIKEMVLTVKAKSASGAQMRFSNLITSSVDFNLTNEFKEYQWAFTGQHARVTDNSNRGDIIIKDIELVQKPLPKLTINGIDGFNSGKWTLHANAVVIDDETLELNAVGAGNNSFIDVEVIAGQTYTCHSPFSTTGQIFYMQQLDSTKTLIANVTSLLPTSNQVTYTMPSNCKYLRVIPSSVQSGKFTFKKPMLNLGTTPAPYSRKTGGKMVLPVVKKNLLNVDSNFWELGKFASGGVLAPSSDTIRYKYFIPVKPNQRYALTSKEMYPLVEIHEMNTGLYGSRVAYGAHYNTSAITITTSTTTNYLLLTIGSNTDLSKLNAYSPMLQEGQPTPYEPYAVQVNNKPLRYTSTDIFNKATSTSATFVSATDGLTYASGQGHSVSGFTNVKPNTAYEPSNIRTAGGAGVGVGMAYYDINKVFISGVGYGVGAYLTRFTTPANAYFVRFTYLGTDEPNVKLIDTTAVAGIPRAKNGLSFNGNTYIEVSNPRYTLPITYDVLFNPNSWKDSVANALLAQRLGGGTSGMMLFYSKTTNELCFDWHGSTNRKRLGITPSLNTWCRITVSVNETGKLDYYLNGIFVGTQNFPITNTDNVPLKIGSSEAGNSYFFDGVMKYVRVYDRVVRPEEIALGYISNPILDYNFENPSNIVGDKVLMNAKNLIPSFEDSRWSLHANADVLGKDVLRLEASGTFQLSQYFHPVNVGDKFLYKGNVGNGRLVYLGYKADKSTATALAGAITGDNSITLTIPADTAFLRLSLDNGSLTTGTFDFIKPQLYELSGKEGTIVGKPTPQLRPAVRQLHAIR